MSKELTAFKDHFEAHTGIITHGKIEENHCPHWKRLTLPALDCEQMETITSYIRGFFSRKGKYSHLLPKVHSYGPLLVLSIDVEQIKLALNL